MLYPYNTNNNTKEHNLHLHFIPQASQFTFKVLLTACLHCLWLNLQKLDLKINKGGANTKILLSFRCNTG